MTSAYGQSVFEPAQHRFHCISLLFPVLSMKTEPDRFTDHVDGTYEITLRDPGNIRTTVTKPIDPYQRLLR